MKTPRPYQAAAIKAFWHWVYHETGYQFIGAAVNAGKSLIIAEIIRQVMTKWPTMRILVLIDEQQLLQQNMAELREQFPDVDAGFYCAGLNQKRLHNDVTLASIQSIWKKAHLLNRAPNLIIIDEGHGVSENKDTQFRKFIADCESLNPKLHVVGLSGSKYRMDSGIIYGGENSLYAGMSYEINVKFMIDEGYSIRPVMPKVGFTVDTSAVRQTKTDYNEADLQRAFDVSDTTERAVAEIVQVGRAENRLQWLVYTSGVDHCENVAAEFRRHGVTCKAVHSKISEDSSEIFASYKRNEFQCMVVVGKAVKGFSHNGVELIAYLTKTRSPVKYEQTIGRGMRTNYAPGMPLDTREQRLAAIAASRKPNFTLMDYGGVVAELGPIDDMYVNERKSRKKQKEEVQQEQAAQPEMKFCPKCETPASRLQRVCYECGYEFMQLEEIETKAALLSDEVQPERLEVYEIAFTKHRKRVPEDAPPPIPVMKVTYHTAAGRIYEWVCFEHQGLPKRKAIAWHKEHMPFHPNFIPATVDEALELMTDPAKANATSRYAKPHFITAKKKGKFWDIVGKEMPTKEELEELARRELMPEPEIDF
jgi:DNA repair protein RadD